MAAIYEGDKGDFFFLMEMCIHFQATDSMKPSPSPIHFISLDNENKWEKKENGVVAASQASQQLTGVLGMGKECIWSPFSLET